ncbi:FYVE zinc finger-domain-containing protein [Sparassis latifolia]
MSSSVELSVSDRSLRPLDCQFPRTRQHEHLAVLIPKHLWKPDAQASHCDIFRCHKRFSMWERKHHCRKCGGVFCVKCSTRFTALLDTANLGFLNPPRDIPIAVFDSPTSPVRSWRVCDDCWYQIHGCPSPRPSVIKTRPLALVRESDSDTSSISSSVSSSPEMSTLRPSMRRIHASPRILHSPLRPSTPSSSPPSDVGALIEDAELSLGELESYPLKHSSVVCKANGGGRWEPKPIVALVSDRLPGGKAPYEIELEREEDEIRRRRANPIIRNGDFQLRAPREVEPRSPAGPICLSTF